MTARHAPGTAEEAAAEDAAAPRPRPPLGVATDPGAALGPVTSGARATDIYT